MMSDEEYEALSAELVAKQNRRAVLDKEIEGLSEVVENAEYMRRNLPTEPGKYWHPDGWPAYLDENGRWTDGWGNEFEDYGRQDDLEGLKRVEWV